MGTEAISRNAADLGGPFKLDSIPLLPASPVFGPALPPAAALGPISVVKPVVAAGTDKSTRDWQVSKKGAAPTTAVPRVVTVPLAPGTIVTKGSGKSVSRVEYQVPIKSKYGAVTGIVGTEGGKSSVVGVAVQTTVVGDALSLGAEYRSIEPNNGSQTGKREWRANVTAKVNQSEVTAGLVVADPNVSAGRTATYSIGATVPLREQLKLKVDASYTQASDANKDRYTISAGALWPDKGVEIRLDTGAAETNVQVRGRISF